MFYCELLDEQVTSSGQLYNNVDRRTLALQGGHYRYGRQWKTQTVNSCGYPQHVKPGSRSPTLKLSLTHSARIL
jgi:hypothetical protein